MIEINRRFFLGGAISLAAASTFIPTASSANFARIYGDGVNDDSHGLGCLFRNEPVIFHKEQIGIDDHKLITFHKGIFVIKSTVHVPLDAHVEIVRPTFIGLLEPNDAFFNCEPGFRANQFDTGLAIFKLKSGATNKLIYQEIADYGNFNHENERTLEWLK